MAAAGLLEPPATPIENRLTDVIEERKTAIDTDVHNANIQLERIRGLPPKEIHEQYMVLFESQNILREKTTKSIITLHTQLKGLKTCISNLEEVLTVAKKISGEIKSKKITEKLPSPSSPEPPPPFVAQPALVYRPASQPHITEESLTKATTDRRTTVNNDVYKAMDYLSRVSNLTSDEIERHHDKLSDSISALINNMNRQIRRLNEQLKKLKECICASAKMLDLADTIRGKIAPRPLTEHATKEVLKSDLSGLEDDIRNLVERCIEKYTLPPEGGRHRTKKNRHRRKKSRRRHRK
jgi:hypothetical protein